MKCHYPIILQQDSRLCFCNSGVDFRDDRRDTQTSKNTTQRRRVGSTMAATVTFTSGMKVTFKSSSSHANQNNKQRLIEVLRQRLGQNGCTVQPYRLTVKQMS